MGEGRSEVDVENRIRIVRMKWKNVFRVIFERKMQVELKDRVFSVILRPKMAHASEYCVVMKKEVSKLNSVETKDDVRRWARKDDVSRKNWGEQSRG